MASTSPQQSKSHRKIRQWPRDRHIFATLVRDAIANGTSPNTLFTELDPIEPEVNQPALSPERVNRNNGPWAHGETFLHRALRLKLYELAEFLLRKGAEVDKRNEPGRTPLHETVLNGDWQGVVLLIKHNAGIEALTAASDVVWYRRGEAVPGEGGLTPIHLAIYNSDVNMMRLLVSLGADVNHGADDSWSYLDLALLQEDPRATAFFLSQGLKLRKEPSGFADPKESKAAAQELQTYASSRRLIPPRELWDSYKEALSRLHFCKWGVDMGDEGDPPSTDLIVATFSEHLETLAGMSSDYRQFCDDCRQLTEELSSFYQENSIHNYFEYRLKPNRQALLETASREESPCALCAYVADSLDFEEAKVQKRQKVSDEWEASEGPIDVCFSMVDVPYRFNDTVRAFKGACDSSGFCPEMYTYPDGVGFRYDFNWINALELPPMYEKDGPQLGTGSRRAFAMAEKWLSGCQKHKACEDVSLMGASNTYHPRLLHVSNAPRLVIDRGDGFDYVALSCCPNESSARWETTSDNLEQRMDSIDFDSLPPMFKEAIVVTRELGFQYIWIEDICMVQDSAEALSRKTTHLPSIYAKAALTISKVDGASATQPLYSTRLSRSLHPVPLKIWQPKARRPAHSAGVVHSFALARPEYGRAPTLEGLNLQTVWSLQAELFSSRILHFGNGMLHWECLSEYKNEALCPWRRHINKIVEKRLKPRAVFRGASNEHTLVDAAGDLSPMENWQFLLEIHSDRQLGKALERMAAFWVIGKHMEGNMGDEFSCGLWKSKHFLQSLCWAAMEPATIKPMLPTWTWVSNQQQLTFACLDTTGRHKDYVPLTELVSWDGVMCPHSYAVSGTLTLEGPLYPLEQRSKDWAWDTQFLDFERGEASCDGEEAEDMYPSVFDGIDVTGCHVLDVLGIKGATGDGIASDGWQWPAGRAAAKVALLLEEVDATDAVFRRAGIVSMDFVRGNLNPSKFRDKTLVRTITLI